MCDNEHKDTNITYDMTKNIYFCVMINYILYQSDKFCK